MAKHRKLLLLLVLLLGLAGCGSTKVVTHTVTTSVPAKGASLITAGGNLAPPTWPIAGGRPHHPGFGTPSPGDLGLSKPGNLALSSTLTIPGADSVTLSNISSSMPAIGCYNSGPYTNCYTGQNASRLFPHAHLVPIAVQAYYHSAYGHADRCLDSEPGDAPSYTVGTWAHAQIYTYHVHQPCIYASSSNMGSVRYYLGRSGLHVGTNVFLWVADWDNSPVIPSGYQAKQWASNPRIDSDSFLPSFFGTPPLPLCARTMCYAKFSTYVWHNPKTGPCHHGCAQRQYMYAWQHATHKSHKYRVYLRYRGQAIQKHLEYEIKHGHNNTATRKLAHIFWAWAYQAAWRSTYDKYVEVKG